MEGMLLDASSTMWHAENGMLAMNNMQEMTLGTIEL